MSMLVIPIGLKQANQFVRTFHRHHRPVQGHRFSLGLVSNGVLVAVVICGRPISRHLDDGFTLEVTRLCTNGTRNACSQLYSACARVAREMGYNKIITYILVSESGVSLKASGWQCEAVGVGGKAWGGKYNGQTRTGSIINLFGEEKKYPNEMKQRWMRRLNCR